MKKRLLSFILMVGLVASSCALNACKGSQNYTLSYYDYFDTYCTFTLYGIDEATYQTAKSTIDATLQKWHQLTDIYHEYPNIANVYSINQADGCQTLISNDLAQFLIYCVKAYSLSLGTVNICMGSVTKLWHDAMETKIVPSSESLSEAALHTSIDNLSIAFENNGDCLVSLIDIYCQLDVGALAKGYVANILYQQLLSLGITDFLMNLGGAITTHGKPIGNNRDCFRIGVLDANAAKENPDTQTYITPYIDISCCGSVITSGNYMRYFEANGIRYNHIIDASKLSPANRYDSVSVILDSEHNDPALGDLLSTALFILDMEDGLALAKQYNAKIIYQYNGVIETY